MKHFIIIYFFCTVTVVQVTAQNVKAPLTETRTQTAGLLQTDYPKVAMQFAKLFSGAEELFWAKQASTMILNFYYKGYKTAAAFSLSGKMKYVITETDVALLPDHVKEFIQVQYRMYEPISVKHIKKGGEGAIYQVIIQNCREYVTIYADAEEILSVKETLKAGN